MVSTSPYLLLLPKKYDQGITVPTILFYQKKIIALDTIPCTFYPKNIASGDTHITMTTYLMVVTCENEPFMHPHSNFREIFLLSSLWQKVVFWQKFLQDFAHDNFFCFQHEIFFRFSVQNFSICHCLVYSLYYQLKHQKIKDFQREIFTDFLRFPSQGRYMGCPVYRVIFNRL